MAVATPRRYRILLVEDEIADANLLINALKHVDALFSVDVVEHGEAALAYLHKKHPYEQAVTPDLLIADLNLPRVDGRELLKQLRSEPRFEDLAVMVFTMSHSEQDRTLAHDCRATYLQKPTSLEGLNRTAKMVVKLCTQLAE